MSVVFTSRLSPGRAAYGGRGARLEYRLNYCRLFGIELRVGEIDAEHDQRVRLHNRVVAGGKAGQTGQSHVVGLLN